MSARQLYDSTLNVTLGARGSKLPAGPGTSTLPRTGAGAGAISTSADSIVTGLPMKAPLPLTGVHSSLSTRPTSCRCGT